MLGILPGAGKKEIKKRYRQLMLQVHPDAGAASQGNYEYSAQEINAAYAVLMKAQAGGGENIFNGKNERAAEKRTVGWDAPVNENAFTEREVLQYAEDSDGAVLGNFCVAKGKYLWKTDEDFPLFLLSLYQCGRRLLDEVDERLCRGEIPRNRQRFQTELTYLLAQQFIDSTVLLQELASEENAAEDGSRVFSVSAMLELSGGAALVRAGETLYPSGIREHRLYIKGRTGQELGYLSFLDDRLYYVIIPLFEQKRVQVRIQAAKKRTAKRKGSAGRYENLHLWIKLIHADTGRMPESLNLKIAELLKEYEGA